MDVSLLDKINNYIANKNFHSLDRETYSKWAIKELLNDLIINEGDDPYLIVLYFIYKMEQFKEISNGRYKAMFQIAKETGEDVLYLI